MKALDGLKDQRNQGPKAGAGSKSLEPALISQKYGVSGLTTNLISNSINYLFTRFNQFKLKKVNLRQANIRK